MNEFTTLLQQGNAWFFIPSAILLGALHGLEPGHSKTMMAAFIIAIRGTIRQAVMLGLAATLSHTAIVWLIAFGGMYISNKFTAESAEPWLQLVSAVIILCTALWMFWRTWKGEKNWLEGMQEGEKHLHHNELHLIDTGHGKVELSIFEEGQPPHWRLRTLSGRKWEARDVSLVTTRETDEFSQNFDFVDNDDYLESRLSIPEPHDFEVRLSLGHQGHVHDYDVSFQEHEHVHSLLEGLDVNSKEYQNAHELSHANDIKRRFTDKEVTNGQILLFGLTGGLIPCPAAITVLLICIQLKALTLGATLVVSFSIGLALTLVTVGVGAAVSVRQVAKRWGGFNKIAKKAPYFSSALIGCVGVYMGIHGYLGIIG
ncbi:MULTISPECIES: nickel/cobalt efflux protein RcnA [Serratia]|jgi:nickel/cobalt transporter (NicO) family protein|uniref:nickel/cobalt efflux protein RcnA n=1 Tax=Serratia TaxID=613 RepID=UPI001A2EDBC1|nr:nickel/cobalt efflux protein RcnA [Serratia liquefaciens]EKN4908435.1 nickel/cobalt efflux protein RcnA [Yersinia enterocolitica]HAT3731509.1 nickel/cobalt efflux protein RcnA [Serratia marcescens]HDM8374016.1 nickel/cobalt efflux protein RcnA [Yersinia enterocolitica]HEN3244212.1 nickel/cobalt efflux protein RcnA [Yersinia enterocolitica]HEN3450925.1 nickel/cobalt efflux protein RcnA [Yersinia enterocolitica]